MQQSGGGGIKVEAGGSDFIETVVAGGGRNAGNMIGTKFGRGGGSGGGPGSLIRSLLDEVRPGDLITSDFMRRLLGGLAGLEEYVGQLDDSVGIGTVPDVIFLQLPKALAMLRANEPALKIEGAYDPFGNKIKIDDETLRGERIVLAQFPVPGAKITGDRLVKLLVSTEMSKWMLALELLVDRGPEIISAWQNRNQSQKAPQSVDTTGTVKPEADPATATPATAAPPAPAATSADDAATKTATRAAKKARARRRPAKPAGG